MNPIHVVRDPGRDSVFTDVVFMVATTNGLADYMQGTGHERFQAENTEIHPNREEALGDLIKRCEDMQGQLIYLANEAKAELQRRAKAFNKAVGSHAE